MKAQRIKSSTRWTRGAGRKRSVAASLVVALSPGCVFGPMTEVRRTTIDESALLPVPVGPRALGSLPDKGVVVAELRANRTFAPAPMDAAALASTSQYYLENIAQFRLAKALGSRMELSLTADYGLPMRSPPTTPYQNLALQNSGSLWSTLSMRGLLGRNRQLCAVVGAETSAGTATYARRDHTEITTFSPTTHKPTIASLLFLEPQASSADPVLTVNETTRQGSDLATAWTTWLGVHAEPTHSVAMDFTLFGQLVPVYPGRRVVEQTCYTGGCLGERAEQVPNSIWRTAFGLSVAGTIALGGGVAALFEVHLHQIGDDSGGGGLWPGAVVGLRMPIGAGSGARPIPQRQPSVRQDKVTKSPNPPQQDVNRELERVLRLPM